MSMALRRLGRLPQTERQLTDYLARRGVTEQVRTEVVARLRTSKLLDDAEYAEMFARSRRRTKQAGNSLIRRELRERGVDTQTIEAAIEAEQVDDRDLAAALAERKWLSLTRLDVETRRRRTVGFLVRRGHSASLAYSVVRELAATDSGNLDS